MLAANGNLLVCGSFAGTVDFDATNGIYNLSSTGNYDVFIAEYNLNGQLQWVKSFGGAAPDEATALTVDYSGAILLTGNYGGNFDAFILKLGNAVNGLPTSQATFSSEVKIYPTLFTTAVTMELATDHLPVAFQLYNALGQLVYQTQLTQLSNSLPLDYLLQGIYLGKVIQNSHLVYLQKLIKQ